MLLCVTVLGVVAIDYLPLGFMPVVAEPEVDIEVPQFFGLEIAAQRIVFVIDCSMSMRKGDPSRLERVRSELGRLIGSLPRDAEFSVIAFNSSVKVMSPKLLPATAENKTRDALRDATYEMGSTISQYWGALRVSQ